MTVFLLPPYLPTGHCPNASMASPPLPEYQYSTIKYYEVETEMPLLVHDSKKDTRKSDCVLELSDPLDDIAGGYTKEETPPEFPTAF